MKTMSLLFCLLGFALAEELPVSKTNPIYNEIVQYMDMSVASRLVKELTEKNAVTVFDHNNTPLLYTADDLLSDPEIFVDPKKPELGKIRRCFNDKYPWNIGCIAVHRVGSPKYAPFVRKVKKPSDPNSVDALADESVGIGIIDMTENEARRGGSEIDILNFFKKFENYQDLAAISEFFKNTKELTQEDLISKGIQPDGDLGFGTFYQASRIQLGAVNYQAHQTLRYNVSRHPDTGVITVAWQEDRRFANDSGFMVFPYMDKNSQSYRKTLISYKETVEETNEKGEIVEILIPIYNFEKKEFEKKWLTEKRLRKIFISNDHFNTWMENEFKAKILNNEKNKKDWIDGKYELFNHLVNLEDGPNYGKALEDGDEIELIGPIYDFKKNDFEYWWKTRFSKKHFPSPEQFKNWKETIFKTHILDNTKNKQNWIDGKYKLHNNQFGIANVYVQSGYLLIIPYKPHQFIVVQQLYIRLDENKFKELSSVKLDLRYDTQVRFMTAEASAIRREILDALKKEKKNDTATSKD
ncbi:MAG: hypothetical protein HYS98_01390 [Deltaproteobacteria bacterium]|nr:hypothetical protein [Deltaproteobacteria bacterium]